MPFNDLDAFIVVYLEIVQSHLEKKDVLSLPNIGCYCIMSEKAKKDLCLYDPTCEKFEF